MAAKSFVDSLIDKGMNRGDLTDVSRAMVSRFNQINEVHTKVEACRRCDLYESCINRPLSGIGSMNPEIVVVSDIPEEREARYGMTGFAEYSIYLMAFFKKLGLEWDDIFWTHAVKCKTDEKTTMHHITECLPNLVSQLARLKPTVIVALGTTAISSLQGEPTKIQDAIGEELYFTIGSQEVPVIAIEHPRSFLSKGEDVFKDKTRDIWRELKAIANIIEPADEESEEDDDDDDLDFDDLEIDQ